MKLIRDVSQDRLEVLLNHADKLCKEFDQESNCKKFLLEKMNLKTVSIRYLSDDSDSIIGIAILEILDTNYGNIILHSMHESDEQLFARFLFDDYFIGENILELIQFRSNFNYRDSFIACGCKEKERVRMVHKNIQEFRDFTPIDSITFKPIMKEDADICGEVSYLSHKHRVNIERYDVYITPKKRAKFCLDLRSDINNSIPSASLLMFKNGEAIGVIEITHTHNWGKDIGWIMDVALLPKFQGIGLGKHLIEKALFELHKLGYEYAGLGVTLTNMNAHQLYERMGFQNYEYFAEIIGQLS